MSSVNITDNSTDSGNISTKIFITTNCTLSANAAFSLNVVPILLLSVMIVAQLFNLIVFHFWRQKEPYILLHVSLAVSSLLYGFISFATPATRIFKWNDKWSETVIRLVGSSFHVLRPSWLTTLLFIAIDRWLSIEYAVQYRTRISKKKIRQAILLTWIIALMTSVPGKA